MKRIVITGASGFIGLHCLEYLSKKDYEIHALDINPLRGFGSKVNWYVSDLLNSGQLVDLISKIKPTHLLHLAWCTKPKIYWTSFENLRWVRAGLALIEEFWKVGGKRVVMAGTCAEYDWNYGYCSEKVTPLSPSSIYGICKHSLQTILSAFARQTGLSAAWGRLFFLYGPREHPERLVPLMISSLLNSEQVNCTDGQQIRDYLFIKDVAAAYVALLESNITGPINIASGQPVSIKDIILTIAEKLNRSDLVRLGALKRPPNDPLLLVADITRLKNELGWSPQYDLDKGIDETIMWWKNKLNRLDNEQE